MKQSTNLKPIEWLSWEYLFTKTLFPFDNAKVGRIWTPSNYFFPILKILYLFLTYINVLCSHTILRAIKLHC